MDIKPLKQIIISLQKMCIGYLGEGSPWESCCFNKADEGSALVSWQVDLQRILEDPNQKSEWNIYGKVRNNYCSL